MIKISNSGLKITYLGADFKKPIIVIFEISILEFVKYMFYVRGLLSEGSGPDLGLLYKIFPITHAL